MLKKKFDVGGMSCSACSSAIEKAVGRINGVLKADVSLMEKSMTVVYDEKITDTDEIISTVKRIGYTAEIFGSVKDKYAEIAVMKKRFFISLCFLIPLMYLSMGKMIGLPSFSLIGQTGVILDLSLQFLLATAVIIINRKFYVSGLRALFNRSPNMDTLVFIGSFFAYVYSVVVSVLALAGTAELGLVFFESSAMVVTLVTLGKYFEEISKRKTGEEIEKLTRLLPDTAIRIKDGNKETVFTSDLSVGDVIELKAGDYCPIDGVITGGTAAVDKSAITGESIPVETEEGEEILSGSVISDGYITVKCVKVGNDTVFSKIVEMVKTAGASKVPIQKFADGVSAVFVPIVLLIALITFFAQLLFNGQAGIYYAFKCAISVVVVSCPCALGLATPVAVMAATGKGASLGILFKDGETIQKARKINCVLLDKTATVTEGKPKVIEYKNLSDKTDETVFAISSALENRSNHPLAKAVADFCGNSLLTVADYNVIKGKGATGVIDGALYSIGSFSAEREYFTGVTNVVLSENGKDIAAFAVADTVKADSYSAIKALKSSGILTVMITGDNSSVARSVAEKTGIDIYESSVMPDRKAEFVNKYRKDGYFVAFVGDGINDSPAIKTADVGIAVDNGTDIAVESADAVIVGGSLTKLKDVIGLSGKTVKIIKENLFWAFFYNLLLIPVAAGVFAFLGISFEPWMAALCMSVSSVMVVLNALRINGYGKRKRIINEKTDLSGENKEYDMEIKVEGMMCEHCKKRVETAVCAVEGVKKAKADLKKKTVIIKGEPDINAVKSSIEQAGYKVIG